MDSDFENLKKKNRGAAEGQKTGKNGTHGWRDNVSNIFPICLKFSGFAHRYQSYRIDYKIVVIYNIWPWAKFWKSWIFREKNFWLQNPNFFEYDRYTLVSSLSCSFDNYEQTLKISAKSEKDSKSYQGNRGCRFFRFFGPRRPLNFFFQIFKIRIHIWVVFDP